MRPLALLTLLGLCSCATFKVENLDRALNEKGAEFAKQSEFSIDEAFFKQGDYNPAPETRQFLKQGNGKVVLKGIQKKYNRPHGFQCFEPYLLVVSIGLIPAVCEEEYTATFAIANENSPAKEFQINYKERSIHGLISIFTGSLWTRSPANDLPDRALYTAGNKYVEGK